MKKTKVIALSGSLRKGSFTTMLINAFQQLAPVGVDTELLNISELPLVNQDLESDLPDSVSNLHQKIAAADAVILATPEYNRSYSPVIKNALDWGSRPEGKNKWKDKPVLLLGCSPYSLGAFGGVNHLRQVVMYLDMPPVQQPEFYLSMAGEKFDDKGDLKDEQTIKLIKDAWKALLGSIHSNGH